jgi:hypothetical protein
MYRCPSASGSLMVRGHSIQKRYEKLLGLHKMTLEHFIAVLIACRATHLGNKRGYNAKNKGIRT